MIKINIERIVNGFFILLGVASAIFLGAYAYCLLARKLLSGAEFVAFTLGAFAFSFVVALAGRVTEFSIAGNVVKLKEATKSAEAAYEKLNAAMRGSFKASLRSAGKRDGAFDSIGVPFDSRIPDFISLVETIEDAGFGTQLKKEILTIAEDIMRGQIYKIHQSSPGVSEHTQDPYDPGFSLPNMLQLLKWHMEKNAKDNSFAIESIENYGKLEHIRAKYA